MWTNHKFAWKQAGQYGDIIVPSGRGEASCRPGSNNDVVCYYKPVLELPNGAHYTFNRAVYGCFRPSSVAGTQARDLDIPIVTDDQNAGVIFDGTDSAHLVFSMPDGSVFTSDQSGNVWADNNGNTIRTVTALSTGKSTITDTVGRVVTINHRSVQYPGLNGNPLTVKIEGGSTGTSEVC